MEVMSSHVTKRLQGLYLVIDTAVPQDRLIPIVEQALEGGVDIVQLWGEQRDTRVLKTVGREILSLTRARGALCLVTDKLEVCKEIGADGVHFDGYELPSITPTEAKRMLGEDKLIGVTCGKSVEKLRWAQENGADYVSFCSIFPSSSVDSCEIVPLEMIRTAKRILSIPVFASGGITIDNVDTVLEAGADGVAVVSAILMAPNPRLAAKAFKEKLDSFVRMRIEGRMS
jgi:thiamine-phosphate pyrophosphorylase